MNRFKHVAVVTALLTGCVLLLTACKKSNDVAPAPPAVVTYKNNIAYFYKQDSADGISYKALMQANNCGVTLIDMAKLNGTDFKKFNLVVFANNCSDDAYDFANVTNAIKAAGTPVLMIGEGGGHFGEMINAAVSWGTSVDFTFPLNMTVVDSTSSLYKSPKKIQVPANLQLPIFSQSPYGQAFMRSNLLKYPNVELIGKANTANANAFSITLENDKYCFFGYYNNVSAMSQTGKDFMVNLTYYIGKLSL